MYIYITCLICTFTIGTLIKKIKRYDNNRVFLLDFIAALKGYNTLWVKDPILAGIVLNNSFVKGDFIEKLIATPAWLPIISLESVDGLQWERMIKNFKKFVKLLPDDNNLFKIFEKNTKILIEKNIVIDSPELARLTIACFTEWIFEIPFQVEWNFVADASWEWRKEIAMKGKSDIKIKQKVVNWAIELLQKSKYSNLFDWKDPENYSLLLQPFIISPAINFTDIAVSIKNTNDNTEKTNIKDMILKSIYEKHPFPILERWLPNGIVKYNIQKNTQVFIPLDQIGSFHQYDILKNKFFVFGVGKRMCPGQKIAMGSMISMFSILLKEENFKPNIKHLYSGRDTDGKETLFQGFYQIYKILEIILDILFKK